MLLPGYKTLRPFEEFTSTAAFKSLIRSTVACFLSSISSTGTSPGFSSSTGATSSHWPRTVAWLCRSDCDALIRFSYGKISGLRLHMVLLNRFWCSWILVDFDSNSVPNTTKQIIWLDIVKLFHLSLSLSSPVFLMMPENSWKSTSLLWLLCGAAMSVPITCNEKDISAEKLQKRSFCLFTRGKQKVYVYLRPIAITSHPQL